MNTYIQQRANALATGFYRRNPHTLPQLQEEISNALTTIYSDDDKSTFLGHYVNRIDELINEHRKKCDGSEDCAYEKSYNAAIFYVKQEYERIEANKQDRNMRRFGTFIGTLNLSGQGSVLNLGKVGGDIETNIHILNEKGNNEISDAIGSLTKAITKATEIDDQQKLEYLEQLDLLSAQAVLPTSERMPKSAIKQIIQFGLGTLNALSSLSTVTGVTLPQIAQFFLG